MIISDSITVGQLTFILRVAVQILSYGGIAVIIIILLGTTPRVAPVSSHDVVNRVVGSETTTKYAGLWLLRRLRRNQTHPATPTALLFIILLYVSYTLFVSVSDIGFLGFYACSVPGRNIMERPASVSSEDAARSLIALNLVNGTDPNAVRAFRCSSSQLVHFGTVTENNCTSWQNSTYAESTIFSGLNSTDSDTLMPRYLTNNIIVNANASTFYLNSCYIGPGTKRVKTTTTQNGIIVDPLETGVTAVFGVPQLTPDTKVSVDQTLALEVEVGCMTVGVYAEQSLVSSFSTGFDVFATTGSWRKYTGPDYMLDTLTNITDQVRAYFEPFFELSTLDSSGHMHTNSTTIPLTPAANVYYWNLPDLNGTLGNSPQSALLGNCTQLLQNQLGITTNYDKLSQGSMCSFLGVGGSISSDGVAFTAYSRMVCATATQVNMVSATAAMDEQGNLSLNSTRLPSDLNYLVADYWSTHQQPGDVTEYLNADPIERFTLSSNPNSPTSHYIAHRSETPGTDDASLGSPGNAISSIGHILLDVDGALDGTPGYAGLTLLDQGFNQLNFTPSMVTEWAGQVGASYVLTSLAYNGWAALDSKAVEVVSTGGQAGTCYKPLYAIGFLPLVLAAAVVTAWAFVLVFKSSLFSSTSLKEGYGGISPFVDAIHPGVPPNKTILAWESTPKLHLQAVSKGEATMDNPSGTALGYLKSEPAHP